ncbi:uncharacterized protein [Onthophagus taurus]|uniref:uncharacterized protein n=1 Tax=Onthophagus taurus TaxID=166361 RepID=UPI000C2006C0|nr:uncharacterized protein LOC111428188 [Onthophagus taurus]XP_022919386.1 uncharacterized protein LOC111428188 [Onthophagus taurus]
MGIKMSKKLADPNNPFWRGKDTVDFYIRQHPEVTPIFVIAGFVYANVPWFVTYQWLTRPDYCLVSDPNGKRVDEKIDLENPKVSKFLKFHEIYNPQPELARIYREMDEEEKNQGLERE